MTDDGGPALLLEQRTDDAITGPFIRRLGPDGVYAEYSSVVGSIRDGQIVTETVPLEWREQARLDGAQVSRVEAALRSGFFGLDAAHRPDGVTVDGYEVTWRASLDGQTHTVTLHSIDVATIPALAAVRDTFELVLAEAAASAGG